ncbi:MAG: crossover junction endodeoxyribonuclease RuvC, partial [Syntrophales bacterium LBB04]|nr:crossover junction endodeoxyribonuclease RuvC [Syntrophales bacterium LBB04]
MEMVSALRILGIDPGIHITGYGVVEKQKSSLKHVMHGEIKMAKGSSLSSSLSMIYDNLLEVINQSSPDAIVVEDIFYGKNIKSLI